MNIPQQKIEELLRHAPRFKPPAGLKDRLIAGVVSRKLGARGFIDRRCRDEVNALPRADVDASLARDALGLIDVNELLWLYRLR